MTGSTRSSSPWRAGRSCFPICGRSIRTPSTSGSSPLHCPQAPFYRFLPWKRGDNIREARPAALPGIASADSAATFRAPSIYDRVLRQDPAGRQPVLHRGDLPQPGEPDPAERLRHPPRERVGDRRPADAGARSRLSHRLRHGRGGAPRCRERHGAGGDPRHLLLRGLRRRRRLEDAGRRVGILPAGGRAVQRVVLLVVREQGRGSRAGGAASAPRAGAVAHRRGRVRRGLEDRLQASHEPGRRSCPGSTRGCPPSSTSDSAPGSRCPTRTPRTSSTSTTSTA